MHSRDVFGVGAAKQISHNVNAIARTDVGLSYESGRRA
jgi:hypothetical protein